MDAPIPFFPLGILLLPGEQQYLHIFEPRYRQLLDDLENGLSEFVIPFVGDHRMEQVGSVVRLAKVVDKHPNGTSDIIIESVGNAIVQSYSEQMYGKKYPGGYIRKLHWNASDIEASPEVLRSFEGYERRSGNLNDTATYSNDVHQIQLAIALHLNPHQKLAFIKGDREKRNRIIETQLHHMELLLNQEEKRFGAIYLN